MPSEDYYRSGETFQSAAVSTVFGIATGDGIIQTISTALPLEIDPQKGQNMIIPSVDKTHQAGVFALVRQ